MCYVYGSKYAAVELIDGLRSSENISQRLQVVLLVVSFILIMCPDVFRPSAENSRIYACATQSRDAKSCVSQGRIGNKVC